MSQAMDEGVYAGGRTEGRCRGRSEVGPDDGDDGVS